jgi:hypothetical protein
MEQFDQKTADLLKATKEGNTNLAISLSGLPKHEVESFLPQFKKRLEGEIGKWNSTEIIGTVGRRNGEYHLTAVRLKGETKATDRLIIWQGSKVSDFRPLPEGNTKSFEHRKGNEFFAESNNRVIRFDSDERSAKMTIQSPKGPVIARRHAD